MDWCSALRCTALLLLLSVQSLPTVQRQWQLPSAGAGLDALRVVSDAAVPRPSRGEVLVRVRATSINYRDLVLATTKHQPTIANVVPLSDGAGDVAAIGEGVTEFKVGDRVTAILCPDHLSGRDDLLGAGLPPCLGGMLPGMLAQFHLAKASALVKIADHLSYEEAATLACAGVTAYSALTGGRNALRAGSIVLVQGTGGVSILAAQIAAASGCRVIATSSSDEKLRRMQQLGLVAAADCINYKTDPEWGATVRRLTPDGRGVDLVVEVGGPGTVAQSLTAVRRGGDVALVGLLAHGVGGAGGLDYAHLLMNLISVRGVLVGPREDFRGLMDCLAVNKVRPVVDRCFPFDQAVDAFRYVQSGQHFGKVVVTVE